MKGMLQRIHDSVEGFVPAGQMPRPHFLSLLGSGGLALVSAGYPAAARAAGGDAHGGHAEGMNPDEALAKLMAGNKRYVARKAQHPNRG